MFKCIIILFLLSSSLFAQEWINVSPMPDSMAMVSGSFISSTEGWVINKSFSAGREIYFTSDGGNSWDMIFNFNDNFDPITSIFMIDSLNGWLTLSDYNDYNSFYKTSNGGHTWQDMTGFLMDVEDISAYYFIDENIGFISTFVYTDLLPNLYKTIDGGYSWESIEVPPIYILNEPVNYQITTFFFLNDSIGWAGCAYSGTVGNVLYTSDGGENWIAMDNSLLEVSAVQSVTFRTEQNGVLLCFGCIYPYVLITTDNCSNYTQLNIPGYDNAVNFQNDSTIWIAESSGGIYRSTDLGDTFDLVYLTDSYIYDIYFFNNIGYFFASNNTLLKFTDQIGIDNDQIPTYDYSLSTFPNPFNPTTTISFSIPEESKVEINVYNIKGQKVRQLISNQLSAGQHSAIWNGNDESGKSVSSGVYVYKLTVNGKTESIKKCLMLK